MKRLAYLLTVFLVVITACSSGVPPAPPTPAPTVEPTVAPAPTEVGRAQGGTLRLLWWQAPTILNPHLAQGTKDTDASRLVLEPLAAIGPDGSYVPELAADIPTVANGGISADLKTTTWKLKSGVKWSDGTDFTADDVVFNWHYQSDKETAATDAKTVAGIDKVEATDATTVVITWHEPNPNSLQAFTGALGQIIEKKQFEQYVGASAKDAPGNLKPIGTGPYKVSDFKPGDVVTYQANELYRDASRPFFSDVELKGGGDAASA
ncbi:MAG: peptide ABC transporter substrate-binding protein, partial [Chloroflexi bacterium]|nr:peptide ABC transporter substrate-binding protein [Chloroflexota bacterium]